MNIVFINEQNSLQFTLNVIWTAENVLKTLFMQSSNNSTHGNFESCIGLDAQGWIECEHAC